MRGRRNGEEAGLTRRRLVAALGLGGAAAASATTVAMTDLMLPGKPRLRPLTVNFPGKRAMILQRSRPPLLETPFEVFDQGVFTPNDRFFVRWHWANIPTSVDAATFRLSVRGHVARPVELTLADLLNGFERIDYAAVNQCSGNSRGFFEPAVPGGEWANGAMGNARWTGVRLRDVLDHAGVRPGAVDVRCGGLDEALLPDAPKFLKSLAIDHARDGEVMIAFAMNGAPLPMLNGFPLRLVVPGWFSTYWVKALNDLEVLDRHDDNFWMAKAYQIPATPGGDIAPGTADFPKMPIGRMVPRAFVTNLRGGGQIAAGKPLTVRGIAFGGDTGVARVELSTDGGHSWTATTLGVDEGKYSFRRFEARLPAPAPGNLAITCRCTNSAGKSQPMKPIWNPGGYMQSGVETITLGVGAA